MHISFSLIQILLLIGLIAAVALPLLLGTTWKSSLPRMGTRVTRPSRNKGFKRTWRKLYLMPIGLARLGMWVPGRHFAPQVTFANIAEGTSTTGNKSYIADAAISARFSLVICGTDANHVAIGAANTEIPLGVTTDMVETANLDVPINVAVFGACSGTQKVVLGGTVANGDWLQSNGDGTAIKLKTTTGSWYKCGRALQAGVSGDVIEFAPCMPDLVVVP